MNNDLAAVFGDIPFDPNSVEQPENFVLLSPGDYPCLIEEAEIKLTKAGTGRGIRIVLLVIDGPSKNRKLFDWINLKNPSDECEKIGHWEFSRLCHAVGFSATCTTQLIGKVVTAHVNVKDDRNNVRTYSAPASTPTAPQGPVPAPAVAAPAPAPAVPVVPTIPVQQHLAANPPTGAAAPAQPTQGSRPWDR